MVLSHTTGISCFIIVTSNHQSFVITTVVVIAVVCGFTVVNTIANLVPYKKRTTEK